MLKNTYTNIKGTKIPGKRIEEALKSIGKTEQEVLDFLGDYGLMPGALFYFNVGNPTEMGEREGWLCTNIEKNQW